MIDAPEIVETVARDTAAIYAAGPESSPDPAEWRTELHRPLVR